jgi:signal transduction histidine kinase
MTDENKPLQREPGSWARLGSVGLLVVAVLLAGGLALGGVMNHRRMDDVASRALEGQALEVGLGSAAALMTFQPRGPERLQRAVEMLAGDHIRSASVVGRKGRVIASTISGEVRRSLRKNEELRRLVAEGSLYAVTRLSGGDRPVYEVWIALRSGLRGHGRRWRQRKRGPRRHGRGRGWGRGPGRGPGPGPGSGVVGRDGRHGPWNGHAPWGRAFLRLEVQVSNAAIAAATRDAGWTRGVTLSAAAALVVLSMLLFVADRRARRMRLVSGRQRSLAEMGEMAAVLAHEIRTPLGVIKGHAQLLAEKSEPAAAEKLALLVEQSGRLERLVNGLLDYARPAPPRLRSVAADRLVEKACELVAADALEREVALIRDLEPGQVLGDPDQLLQLLLNLLRNALQASPDGASVTVRLRYRSGQLLLEVLDAGDGLPAGAPDRQDLFKPFVSLRTGGTGLGLAVSRRIAEAHGGDLRGENGPERGARFVLTLPVSGAGAGAGAGGPKGATS